jgi:transposase
LNSKLHAVCDGQGRPILMLLTEGQASDHRGAALMLPHLPPARELIGDRGYDSGRFRLALQNKDISPCIPSTRSRKMPIPHDTVLYRQRHRIENMFGGLNDWRRIALRYDRCAHTFFSTITLAATVTFWLGQ